MRTSAKGEGVDQMRTGGWGRKGGLFADVFCGRPCTLDRIYFCELLPTFYLIILKTTNRLIGMPVPHLPETKGLLRFSFNIEENLDYPLENPFDSSQRS